MIFQVKAATGEEVSAEDLGGADLHCRHDELMMMMMIFYFLFGPIDLDYNLYFDFYATFTCSCIRHMISTL